MDHRFIGLIEDCMVDIAGFEKEIARPVDDGLVRQDVCHVPRRDLPDSRSDMVVFPDVSITALPAVCAAASLALAASPISGRNASAWRTSRLIFSLFAMTTS